eukprot:CAMPEP_0170939626 /NCGR_PEP_ID=MMETSP0735-20130129/22080_1 /TAXON_ID=186038 /ORGANISM="Fragilariopsis kerguelensis, Strain L26-C5" /LENGTH=247 /DNA_ID=CAMNT_0011345111 /DNA_START=103 /DNA_END=846 /DNA_ORIENTATION=+
MKSIFVLSLAASAAAFAPTPTSNFRATVAVQETRADLETLAKELNPNIGFYDPLNLADAEFWGCTNEESIGFLRQAEIKHGRVAMFGFVGYIVHANGIKFPWAMQMDGTSFPTSTNPPELWDQVSDSAKWQIFGLILFLEAWSEISTPDHKHYMKGGKPGDMPDFDIVALPHPVPFNLFDPFGLSKNRSEEAKARGLRAEINNGRLAMLGLFGFLCAQTIPGSVPLLSSIVQPYNGEVMAPFGERTF